MKTITKSWGQSDSWSFYINKETEVIKVHEVKFTLQTILVLKRALLQPESLTRFSANSSAIEGLIVSKSSTTIKQRKKHLAWTGYSKFKNLKEIDF